MSIPLLIAWLMLAVFSAWVLTLLVERRGRAIGLVAVPNHRSSHSRPTPSGGGLAIAIVTVFSAAILCIWDAVLMLPVMVAVAASAALGMTDDLRDLPALFRFPLQALICTGLLAGLPVLPAMDLPFGIALGGMWLQVAVILVSLWWINLFNFMDGIDGLAGSQAVLVLLGGAAIWWVGDVPASDARLLLLPLVTAAATVGFLLRNWPPARIFMGDAGSYTLATVILAVALLSLTVGSVRYQAWLILPAILVTDATVTLLRRAARGERPWQAHRRHAYQQLSRRWGHHRVSIAYAMATLVWAIPLGATANIVPSLGWLLVGLAYAPLLALAWWGEAGASVETSGRS